MFEGSEQEGCRSSGFGAAGEVDILNQGQFSTCVVFSTARAIATVLEAVCGLEINVHDLKTIIMNTLPVEYIDIVKKRGTWPEILIGYISRMMEQKGGTGIQLNLVNGEPIDMKFDLFCKTEGGQCDTPAKNAANVLLWATLLENSRKLERRKGSEDIAVLQRCVICGHRNPSVAGGKHSYHAMRASHIEDSRLVMCDNSWGSSENLSVGQGGDFPDAVCLTLVQVGQVYVRKSADCAWKRMARWDVGADDRCMEVGAGDRCMEGWGVSGPRRINIFCPRQDVEYPGPDKEGRVIRTEEFDYLLEDLTHARTSQKAVLRRFAKKMGYDVSKV